MSTVHITLVGGQPAPVYNGIKATSPDKVIYIYSSDSRSIVDNIKSAVDIPCEDILSQINAAKSALHKVGQIVLEGHINHCVKDGIEHGDVEQTIANFTKAVERFANMK